MEDRLVDLVTGEPSSETATASRPDGTRADRFKLGLAGYDLWPHSVNFCRALDETDFAEITAVWDDDPSHLRRLVELTGAHGFERLDDFCASDVDGVIVTCRTSRRCAVATAVARAGKHVL